MPRLEEAYAAMYGPGRRVRGLTAEEEPERQITTMTQ